MTGGSVFQAVLRNRKPAHGHSLFCPTSNNPLPTNKSHSKQNNLHTSVLRGLGRNRCRPLTMRQVVTNRVAGPGPKAITAATLASCPTSRDSCESPNSPMDLAIPTQSARKRLIELCTLLVHGIGTNHSFRADPKGLRGPVSLSCPMDGISRSKKTGVQLIRVAPSLATRTDPQG